MYKITHFKEVNMISSKVNLSSNKLLVKNRSTKIQQNHCNQTKNNICQIEGSTVAYVLFDILNIRIKDRKSVDDVMLFYFKIWLWSLSCEKHKGSFKYVQIHWVYCYMYRVDSRTLPIKDD